MKKCLLYSMIFQQNILSLPILDIKQLYRNVYSERLVWAVYLYKLSCNRCFSVCLSDHNSETPGPICLKFWLFYLAWYRPKNYCWTWSSRASCICTIHTEEYRGCISILDWWIQKNTEGYTWIGTDLKETIGVRHLLLWYSKLSGSTFIGKNGKNRSLWPHAGKLRE